MTSDEYIRLLDALEEDEALFLCDVINNVGQGGHPIATLMNLRYFEMPYVRECLDKATTRLTDKGQYLAAVILQRLSA